MNPGKLLLTLSTAIVFAACSTDGIVTPLKTPAGPKLAVATGTASGSYILSLRGNSTPADLADKVASLGGTLIYANVKVGFAAVSGLSSDAAAQLAAFGGVSDVLADESVSLDSPFAPVSADATLVADPSIDSQLNPATAILAAWQWDMASIRAPAAWTAGKLGSSDVTVAILDTGIDYNSLDANGLVDPVRSTSFMSTYVPSPAEASLDPTVLARRADDYVRNTFFPSRQIYTDFNGHGTNVASQVSSKAIAFAGVTSKTTLMAVKVLGSNGRGSLGQVLSGVLYAADNGADVANMSLGGAFSKSGNGRIVGVINKVFNYAKQRGMLIVVAAGNSAIDIQHNGNQYVNYCDAPHVLCVSAVGLPTYAGNPDAPSYYSNYGKSVIGVAAPGGNAVIGVDGRPVPSSGWPWSAPNSLDIASWVWSMCAKNALAGFGATSNNPVLAGCQNGNRIVGYIGTSQAAPHVAGLAASLIAQYGKGNPMQIKKLIERSGDPLDGDLGGEFGGTRINVQRALGL